MNPVLHDIQSQHPASDAPSGSPSSLKPIFKYQPPVDAGVFGHSTCLLTISVGQEVHEGEKFKSTVDLVNASFSSVVMLVDDSLQRHTMALDKSQGADFFYNASMVAGDEWIQRNQPCFSKLRGLVDIVRWDRWLKHPKYKLQKAFIETFLRDKTEYKASFDKTVDAFLERYCRRVAAKDFDMPRARMLCWDYLVEECTALCLWPELNCHFEVYPGKRNPAMEATHARFVVSLYGDILHPIRIKFKNRKQLKPQQFISESAAEKAPTCPQA